MTCLVLDRLTFDFPNGWKITQYDEWEYFTKSFQGVLGGHVKAVDILAVDKNSIAWFIEVKDFRRHPRTKVVELPLEVATKVFDTLAGLLPAKVSGHRQEEVDFAGQLLGPSKLRIVLHLEQPTKHSALFPRAINPSDVQQKLRSLVKAIDPHAIVCESLAMDKVAWSVRSTSAP